MTRKRRVALALFALPPVAAVPYGYWIYNVAGSWLVSTELQHTDRVSFLTLFFIADIIAFSSVVGFIALLLLLMDGHRWRLTGLLLLVPMFLLALVGLALFASHVDSYFRFSR